MHLIADSPLLTDTWIAGHEYHGTDPRFGDGKVVADFWYDAIHRRIYSRSGIFHEVDDPADVRLGRAPGRGSRFDEDDLVRHVRLYPTGEFEIGFETPVEDRVDPLLLVRSAAVMEGSLKVGGAGGNVPHACTVRSATVRGRDARVSCEPTEMAISGGGRCEKGDLKGSRPLDAGASPNGWEVSCGKSAQQTVYAICCAQ